MNRQSQRGSRAAAGLPDGDYYFQVTDPSGEQLLSTDSVVNRQFTVTGGVITAHGGTHPQGMDQDHGAITIGLAGPNCPADFLDTANNGGVYKVWATPVSDYVGNPAYCGGGCFHGFVSSKSKTDNFKANPAPTTPTFCLTLGKQLRDPSGKISPGVEWKITVDDPLGGRTVHTTGADGFAEQDCGLTEGIYIITEEEQGSYSFYDLIRNGVSTDPESSTYILDWKPSDDPDQVIIFVNQEAGIG